MTDIIKVKDQLSDPMWRLSNLYKIVDKQGRKVTFTPNTSQMLFLENNKGRDVILKARQLGFTTLACILGLDEALFNSDWAVLIIAHTLADANKIFETKIAYPYNNLPEALRERIPAKNERSGLLTFNHGSSVQVATSGRSATYQRLHISEFGKICAVYPNKAREIITGSLPAVGKNIVTIESTAEGAGGRFFEMCQQAQQNAGKQTEDWRFHFYPWYNDPNNIYEPQAVVMTPEDEAYFDKIEADNKMQLTDEQCAWWLWQERTLGADMKRENPASPEEAFEQAIDGAYFARQLAFLDKRSLIGHFPIDPHYPINTFWDLGRNDQTAIWFHQYINRRNRFIHYYEDSDKYVGEYISYIRDFAKRQGVYIRENYWPHDGNRDDLFLENGRLGLAEKKHDFTPTIVPRIARKEEGIDKAREVLPRCEFDEKGCALGISRLRMYRKEFDENRGIWKNQPNHDENSHGADAFMTFACGWNDPQERADPMYTNEYALDHGKSLPRDRGDDDEETYDSLSGSY